MSLFELLVLNKLYPGFFRDCVQFIALIFVSIILRFLWEKGIIQFFGIILFLVFIVGIVLSVKKTKYLKRKEQIIKNLAEEFINNTISINNQAITKNDYENFYNELKEKSIIPQDIPYKELPCMVKDELFNAYTKKCNELADIQESLLQEQLKEIKPPIEKEQNPELFKNFFDIIKPYSTNYIETLLPNKEILPKYINKDFSEDDIESFVYLLEHDYNINIPFSPQIIFDTLYLSENTLQHIRNIRNKYNTYNSNEQKMCIVDIALSYNYALQVYNIFEHNFIDTINEIHVLIKKYIDLYKGNLLYIDLLLEYLQKYSIDIPQPAEEDTIKVYESIDVFNQTLKHNIITNPTLKSQKIWLDEIMDCTNNNWKYIYLLTLIIKEIEKGHVENNKK